MRASSFVMVFGDLIRRFLCCSKRTDIKETHDLPSRPKQNSPVPSTSSHSPQYLAAPRRHILDSAGGLKEYDPESSMAPKRKSTEATAELDSPVKKTRSTKKEGKQSSSPLIHYCSSPCFWSDARQVAELACRRGLNSGAWMHEQGWS